MTGARRHPVVGSPPGEGRLSPSRDSARGTRAKLFLVLVCVVLGLPFISMVLLLLASIPVELQFGQ